MDGTWRDGQTIFSIIMMAVLFGGLWAAHWTELNWSHVRRWRLNKVQIVASIVAVALLAALYPWEYNYYVLLRVVVFAAGLYLGIVLGGAPHFQRGLSIVLVITAIIFNPFVPAHLDRVAWAALNVGAAGLFAWVGWRGRREGVQ